MTDRVKVHGATRAPHEPPDRIAWRVRLKSNPTTRVWFRIGVAVIGVTLIVAAPLTGWLPGPGGIPLFLAGLAVLSTEFLWAKRFRDWLWRYVRAYLSWTPRRQRLFWFCAFATLGILQWTYLAIAGIPGWVPQWAVTPLTYLPGVD